MKTLFLFFSLFFIFSCVKKQEEKVDDMAKENQLRTLKEYKLTEEINPAFKKEIENWEEFNAVHHFLERFKKTSTNEVLSNALELRDLVAKLKESTKPKLFETDSFKTRIDILNNEVLRLADMTFISAITEEEVELQTDKVLKAFAAVNAKINTIFSKKRFEDEIDIDVSYIGLDTTKMDSVSKKSVTKKLEEDLLKPKIVNEKVLKLKKE